ncbi:MAG: hypothetical protein ACRER3_26180, partial [Pseudomonas fluorescens]
MKSQDILLLFKMASLHAQEENLFGRMESESNSNTVEELLKPQHINRMTAGGRVGQPLATYPTDGEEAVFHRREFDSPLGEEDVGSDHPSHTSS